MEKMCEVRGCGGSKQHLAREALRNPLLCFTRLGPSRAELISEP